MSLMSGLLFGMVGAVTYNYLGFNTRREAIQIRVFDAIHDPKDPTHALAVYSYGRGKFYFFFGDPFYEDSVSETILDPSYLEYNKTYVFEAKKMTSRYSYVLYEVYLYEECCDENGYVTKFPRTQSPIWDSG